MYLLLTSFSVSFVIYLIIDSFRRCTKLADKLQLEHQSVSYADCFLESLNIDIQEYWTWVPTFFKVYIIGIIETVNIALCKRGYFKNSITQVQNEIHTDEIIERFNQDGTNTKPPMAVITGGDSGIGFEISKGLLQAGYHVIIGAHCQESCEETIQVLRKLTLSDKISCLQLDLSSFESVKDFVSQVQPKLPKEGIDVLINNAGVMNIPYRKTEDGFESQSQINLLSPMLLTQLLLPHINSRSGRVLFASSSTLYAMNNLDVNTPLRSYKQNGLDHYAYSKACVAQLVAHLAKTTSIKIYSYHPGTVRTKLFSTTSVFNLPFVSKIFNIIMYSPKEGSQTPLFLSLNKNINDSGSYWANERKQKLPTMTVDGKQNNIKTLWLDTLAKMQLNK